MNSALHKVFNPKRQNWLYAFALSASLLFFPLAPTLIAQDTSDVKMDSLSATGATGAIGENGETVADSFTASQTSSEDLVDDEQANVENEVEETYTGLFYLGRWNLFLLVLIFSSAILYFTNRAKRGDKLFIRKIPGLDAIEEAVGRATEMGRTVLFIPGLQELDEIQTIAGLSILNRVARITAEYETPIVVPVRYPLIYAGAQETVKQAYISVGRQDSYDPDSVRYVAGEQFAYTAHVNGWMMREKPATNIYMGAFFAESLLLAETGFAAGAIQIAGTAEIAQLPFFITACDYTLIGEELFAASAYLSHDPIQLGGLKGQDAVKVLLLVTIVIGTIGMTFFPESLGELMAEIWDFKKTVGQW